MDNHDNLVQELLLVRNELVEVCTFIRRNIFSSMVPFYTLKKVIERHIPPEHGKKVYRATKIPLDGALPKLLERQPFTLKQDRPLRSWSTSHAAADRFFHAPTNAVAIMLTGETTPETTLLDFSNPEIIQVLDTVMHKFHHKDDWEARDTLSKSKYVLNREKEVMRMVSPKQQYTFGVNIDEFNVIGPLEMRSIRLLQEYLSDNAEQRIVGNSLTKHRPKNFVPDGNTDIKINYDLTTL